MAHYWEFLLAWAMMLCVMLSLGLIVSLNGHFVGGFAVSNEQIVEVSQHAVSGRFLPWISQD